MAPVAVFVPALNFAARIGEVTVTVRVNRVVMPHHTRQCAVNNGTLNDVVEFTNPRQNVVAWVAFLFHHFIKFGVQRFVKLFGKVGLQNQVTA